MSRKVSKSPSWCSWKLLCDCSISFFCMLITLLRFSLKKIYEMSAGNVNGLYLLLVIVTVLFVVMIIIGLISVAPAIYTLGRTMETTVASFLASVEAFSLSVFDQIGRF